MLFLLFDYQLTSSLNKKMFLMLLMVGNAIGKGTLFRKNMVDFLFKLLYMHCGHSDSVSIHKNNENIEMSELYNVMYFPFCLPFVKPLRAIFWCIIISLWSIVGWHIDVPPTLLICCWHIFCSRLQLLKLFSFPPSAVDGTRWNCAALVDIRKCNCHENAQIGPISITTQT